MDWEKLNFTYITYKLAKSNLGNLCLQFKSAPFISMLSPTYKLYMSSKFHKLFASPIRKKQSPSMHVCIYIYIHTYRIIKIYEMNIICWEVPSPANIPNLAHQVMSGLNLPSL